MKLYITPGACSFAPHVVLNELGLAHEVDAVDRTTKMTAGGRPLAELNPKGQTPVLELDNGDLLTEGPVILQYLADLCPEAGLLPPLGTLERYRVQEWLSFLGADLHRSFVPMFNPAASEDEKRRAGEAIAGRVGHIDKALANGGPFLMGARYTIADPYAFTLAGWCQHVGIDLSAFPAVTAYLERMAARPSVKAAQAVEARTRAA